MPDNVAQNSTNGANGAIVVQTWNGSSYAGGGEWSVFGDYTTNGGEIYNLDGYDITSWFSTTKRFTVFGVNTIGSTEPAGTANDLSYTNLTYTTTYGCLDRFAWAVLMALATSHDGGTNGGSTGNLPSNDLSGFQAINKMRIKFTVYVSNEDTSYTGF